MPRETNNIVLGQISTLLETQDGAEAKVCQTLHYRS